jgi:hypothetical protein
MVKVFGDPLHQREIHIKVNIKMIKNADLEIINGKMDNTIMAFGKIIKEMEKEHLNLLMEIFMKVNG